MHESTIPSLSVNDRNRLGVDKNIKFFEDRDCISNDGYLLARAGYRYINELRGLATMFDYVRCLPIDPKRVVDVGAGWAFGISELAASEMGKGLLFEATTLKDCFGSNYFLPHDQMHFTSVEYLDGFENESVAAFLGLYSIGYSTALDFAARRINEVLAPGGVIKANFDDGSKAMRDFQQHYKFLLELRKMGYDVGIGNKPGSNILLAIKPRLGLPLTSADFLLTRDNDTYHRQKESLREQGGYNKLHTPGVG